MAATFHAYDPKPRFGADYAALRDFLIRLDNLNYHFGRWDWMITHGYLDESALDRIGLWTDGGQEQTNRSPQFRRIFGFSHSNLLCLMDYEDFVCSYGRKHGRGNG